MQLRLKEIAWGTLLHADQDSGLAALVIPVRRPLRLFRLDDTRNTANKGSLTVALLILTVSCRTAAPKHFCL